MRRKRSDTTGGVLTRTMAARQLEVRYVTSVDVPQTEPLRTPQDVLAVLRPIMAGRLQESLILLHLDARRRLIGWEEVAKGALNAVRASLRDIFRSALVVNAAAIVLSHNHPSGDPTPSPDDVALTERLHAAADLLGVSVLDHIVIADEGADSFAVSSLLQFPNTST